MELTKKQKAIKERRESVKSAYFNLINEMPKTLLVKALATKFKVTEVTIFDDLSKLGLTNKRSK